MVRLKLQMFAKKSNEEIAKEVIKGNYGNGETRKTNLKNAGYDYNVIQPIVNQMLGVGSKNTTNTTNTTKVTNTNTTVPEIKGVDNSIVETITSDFKASDEYTDKKKESDDKKQEYLDHASNKDIVDADVLAGLATPYSNSYVQAQQLLQNKIEQGYAGTYKEALNSILNKFMNREDFEYDVDKDQMFQQALASAMGSGKTAMQDTMGQAAALTGGYGSTYATSAGNQAYNSFIQDAYDNLPEYYNMALAAYEAEGQQMLQQYNMLDSADTKEYNQWYEGINLERQGINDMIASEYNAWSANQTMYSNLANTQININAQVGQNLYNAYNVANNEAENLYAKEYQSWQQSIDSAYKIGSMQSADYWNTEEMNYKKSESEREQKNADRAYNYTVEQDKITQSNWEKNYALELAANGATVDSDGKVIVTNPKGATLTNTDITKIKEVFEQSGGDINQVDAYLESIGKNDLDKDVMDGLLSQLTSDPAYQDWTISDDTYNGGWFFGTNWFGGGEDHNDVYSNGTTTMTYDQLKKAINDSNMSEAQKKAKLDALKKQSKK